MKSNVENRTATCGSAPGIVLSMLLLCCSNAAIGGVFSTPVNFSPASATGAAVLENDWGQYVVAANVGGLPGSDYVVDGTLFKAGATSRSVDSVTNNGVTISWNAPVGLTDGLALTDYASDPDLGKLIADVIGSNQDANAILKLTLSGLTEGREYRAQLLMQQVRQGARKFVGITDGSTSSGAFGAGVEGLASVVYSFTADNSGQVVLTLDARNGVNNGNRAVLNAVSVYTAVPEPTSGVLAVLALGGFGMWRFRS
ncbi:hypothetical protein [Aeoliella sp. SH292]|uniref:hypothetical protein n=1 Tax=Aeoliella sp. SH292 TaxID=3454464 RepID=UPI003F98C865